MSRALNAQTFGSIVVIGAFAGAEAAAAYLAACPGSALAWYLNLAVFRPFELARADTSPLHLLFRADALPAALALMLLTLWVRVRKVRLAVAAIANLCFAGAAALAYAWAEGGRALETASLAPFHIGQGPDCAVIIVMLISSFLAFATSHLSFLIRIRSERGRQAMASGIEHGLER